MNNLLPITAFREQIVEAVKNNAVVTITAETGAGKSTQVPQYLLGEGYDIVVTQPRRLAARTVSARVAEEFGEELGGTVGFRTAFERKDSRQTRCLFVTDGLALVRELMGAGRHQILVLDEVHEWNMNIEVLCAWAKRQIESGAPFKLVVMSATLEAEKLSGFFGGAPVISVPGRIFPVAEQAPGTDETMDVIALLRQGRNVLWFKPGKAEIAKAVSDLTASGVSAEILPLHGELDAEEQGRCFKHYYRPKCIVSTNVAQTSVTIDDVDAVVDSGIERRVELVNGVEGLYVKAISYADREQRKGRAGRTKPGIYIDWCSETGRLEFPTAEILRSRLDQTVLRLAEAGIDMEELRFFHQPDLSEIHEAKRALKALGLMDESGKVTTIGHRVAKLPVSVQFGRMLIEADRLGVVDDVITVAAILEQGKITARSKDRYEVPAWRKLVAGEEESDVIAQLAIYKMAERMTKDQMRENGIFVKSFFQAKEKRRHLAEALRGKVSAFSSSGVRKDILRSVCAGMVDHLYKGWYGNYQNGDSTSRELDRESVVRGAEWLVGLPFDLEIKGRFNQKFTLHLISLASKVDPAWLVDIAPHLVKVEITNLRYDPTNDVIVSTRQTTFNGHVVESKEVVDETHQDAPRTFALWLATQVVYQQNADIGAVLSSNAKRQESAQRMNTRAGEEIFKVYSYSEITEQYVVALSGARRIAEVKNPKALLLPELDEMLVAKVARENPDTIELLGEECFIDYPSRYDSRLPQVRLSEKVIHAGTWAKLPDDGVRLPSGRLVEVVANFGLYSTFTGSDILQFKAKMRDHLNRELWTKTTVPVIHMPSSSSFERAEIPPVVEHIYGSCALTGELLVRFGTVAMKTSRSFYDPHFIIQWTTDRAEAERLNAEAVSRLETLRLEERQTRELEKARVEAEGVRVTLRNLTFSNEWQEVDGGLRVVVEETLYEYLPTTIEEIHRWIASVKELITQAQSAIAEVVRKREEALRPTPVEVSSVENLLAKAWGGRVRR